MARRRTLRDAAVARRERPRADRRARRDLRHQVARRVGRDLRHRSRLLLVAGQHRRRPAGRRQFARTRVAWSYVPDGSVRHDDDRHARRLPRHAVGAASSAPEVGRTHARSARAAGQVRRRDRRPDRFRCRDPVDRGLGQGPSGPSERTSRARRAQRALRRSEGCWFAGYRPGCNAPHPHDRSRTTQGADRAMRSS